MTAVNPDAPLTVEMYLREQGLGDDEIREIGPEFGQRLRAAWRQRHGFDPGDNIPAPDLAGRILDEQTTIICRRCESAWGIENEDPAGPCLNCGHPGPAGKHVPSERLPVAIGSGEAVVCGLCGTEHHAELYRVEIPQPPLGVTRLCRGCALATAEYRAWQMACDLSVQIDALMQMATDQKQRDLIAGHIAHTASWFAGWRWPGSRDVNPPADPF